MIMRLADVIMTGPTLVSGGLGWPSLARLVSGRFLSLRQAERGGVDRGDSEHAVDLDPTGIGRHAHVLDINFVGDAVRDAANTRAITPH